MNKNVIKLIAAGLMLLAVLWFNPFSWNSATERTVITSANGSQFVRFQPGLYYAGIYATHAKYPNQISISYSVNGPDWKLRDNGIDIGPISVRFNDPASATCEGIVQYILPTSEQEMLNIHNAHMSIEGLIKKRLAPYTLECLQSCAQLMNTEMHYSGGRAQMAQDYLDQLRNGVFLLNVQEKNTYDSTEHSYRKLYQVQKQYNDSTKEIKRKFSSIKEYGIVVSDAQITNVDYETAIDSLIGKKLAAATKASVSRQELMTAQQQAQTAEAQGKRELVTIEYEKKKEQTSLVVEAETKVKVAEQDLSAQKIARLAATEEGAKIKTLADAKSYEKQRLIQADGALEQKLKAWVASQEYWAKAFGEYSGAIVPQMQMGGGNGGNGAVNFMELMGMKAARDLNLDLSNKK